MTSLSEERAAQKLWRPRKDREKAAAAFDQFVDSEFLPPEEQAALARSRLRGVVAYAAAAIPYYRDLFARLEISPEDIRGPEDLPRLPELGNATIRREESRLRPAKLPKGEHDGGWNTSSGTTGPPLKIYRTQRTRDFDTVFIQRQFRWYRFDPAGSMAEVRVAKDLPYVPPGRPIRLGEMVKIEAWRAVGQYFMTGPFLGFDSDNPMPDIVAWLEQQAPNYLRTTSAILEQLAFARQGRPKFPGLRGLRAASEPLTPGMQARIEETLGAPVHISYGLNEIGWVATRCEAGRYHVYAERFIVEIVGEDGRACAPGEFGRLLITDTANAAMPLLRFVTDDIAQAVAAPCPCGRTLPAVGPIVGRYSQTKDLPAGTLETVDVLREAMERLPPELSKPVREYQVRQTRGGDFELHLLLAGALAPGFQKHIDEVWRRARAAGGQTGATSFTVREVSEIPRTPSLKFLYFVSEITRPREDKDYAAAGGPTEGGR